MQHFQRFSCSILYAATVFAGATLTLPLDKAQAQPGITVYPYCNPEAAPADPGIRADWQASCARQMQQQQQQTTQQPAAQPMAAPQPTYGNGTPVTRYPYCNPEAAPANPATRADWQYSCALQMQQQMQQQQAQPATP